MESDSGDQSERKEQSIKYHMTDFNGVILTSTSWLSLVQGLD